MDERLLRADAIVFDVGNVLLSFDPKKVALLLPQAYREPLFEAMFGPEFRWAKFDLCLTSNEEIADEIAKAANVPGGEEMVLHVLSHFHETMEPLPLYRMIDPLKAMGKRLFALTNYPEPSFTLAVEAFPELKRLEGQIVSSREKIGKPSQEIFRLLASRYFLDPKRTLFIDDVQANVDGAALSGFQTWHYAGEDRLMPE